MLNITKEVSMTGLSTVDGVLVQSLNAKISTRNPENLEMSSYVNNSELYQQNAEQCRTERTEFETQVFAVQKEMIDENKKAEHLES